jgi:hypothetical protein
MGALGNADILLTLFDMILFPPCGTVDTYLMLFGDSVGLNPAILP